MDSTLLAQKQNYNKHIYFDFEQNGPLGKHARYPFMPDTSFKGKMDHFQK